MIQTHRVAVLGAGAVGSYFGGMLAAAGVDVTLIGRSAHVDAIRRDGLRIETAERSRTILLDATTDARALERADIICVATKTWGTEQAARDIASHAESGAVVVSLQNGIGNAAVIYDISRKPTVPCAVYVAVECPTPGRVNHLGRGDLVLGRSPSIPSGTSAQD